MESTSKKGSRISGSAVCVCLTIQWIAIGTIAAVFAVMYHNLRSDMEQQFQQLQTPKQVSSTGFCMFQMQRRPDTGP